MLSSLCLPQREWWWTPSFPEWIKWSARRICSDCLLNLTGHHNKMSLYGIVLGEFCELFTLTSKQRNYKNLKIEHCRKNPRVHLLCLALRANFVIASLFMHIALYCFNMYLSISRSYSSHLTVSCISAQSCTKTNTSIRMELIASWFHIILSTPNFKCSLCLHHWRLGIETYRYA